MKTIKEILIQRDGYSPEQAAILIAAAKADLDICLDAGDFKAAEEICYEHFGLENDYLEELLN
jgi:hypothetical protein